jgi:hypothetical protein
MAGSLRSIQLSDGFIQEAIESLGQCAHRWSSEQQRGLKIQTQMLGQAGDHPGAGEGIDTEQEEVGIPLVILDQAHQR